MNKLRTLVLTLVLLLGTALPHSVSADNGNTTNNSSGMTPEVTIGFGNVTNDTLSFTMDTSVDVYSYQVLMSWDIGAVYCNINGSGGLSEAYNLFVSVLYAGCWTTGYYYGTQGIYHIPAGSNGTLTSIFYQSNSPEVCMGSASYAVLDANDELEWRNATVDPEECLTYTKYETLDDLWYVLDEDSNGDQGSDGDQDSDGDGVGDNADAFPDDANEWDDSDGDGVGDNADAFPDDPTETFDSDGDGVGDNSDMFPFNALEFFDSDGDGVGDNGDAFPNDASESADSDGDGVGDNADAFPTNADEHDDSDGDGVGDSTDAFPRDDTQWEDFDGDGYGDNPDGTTPDACITSGGTSLRALVPELGATTRYVSKPHYGCLDADGDGVGDNTDAFPNDASETLDSDGDGVGSNADQCPGTDTNVTVDVNGCALDGDNDGVPDVDDLCPEVDASTLDLNGDGCLDDDDADGVPNPQDDCPSTEGAAEVSEAGCSEAQLRLLGEGSDDGKTNAGESSDAQTETAASSTQDRFILIGALLIFFVLLGTLTGTMTVSKKENSSFATSFVEGGVAMDELLGLLGRSKMLNVMHALNAHGEGIRFTDLKINVDTSATTLSRRLGELEEFGLVSRTELPTAPMTVVYRLTDAGFSLMPRVEGMFEWALINKQHGD